MIADAWVDPWGAVIGIKVTPRSSRGTRSRGRVRYKLTAPKLNANAKLMTITGDLIEKFNPK